MFRAGSQRRVISLRVAGSALALVLVACKTHRATGELAPPSGAPAWDPRLAVAFDDDVTKQKVRLSGRAPNDVLDQRLFAARLGHAAIVAVVRVEQVWGRGRYEGKQQQYVEVELQDILLGQLPAGTDRRQRLWVESDDDLPGTLKHEQMLLFVRWAASADPPLHHHLMPADRENIAVIRAMVDHARASGVLRGQRVQGCKRKRAQKKAAKVPQPSKTKP